MTSKRWGNNPLRTYRGRFRPCLRGGGGTRGRSDRVPFRGNSGGARRSRPSAYYPTLSSLFGRDRGDMAAGRGGLGGVADMHGEPRSDGERG